MSDVAEDAGSDDVVTETETTTTDGGDVVEQTETAVNESASAADSGDSEGSSGE